MNLRIKEIFQQAGGSVEVCDVTNDEVLTYNEYLDPEKFAELIIRECIGIVSDAVNHREPASTYVNKIKEHFGVE